MKTTHNGPQLTLRTLETTAPKERSEPVRIPLQPHSEQHWLSPTCVGQKRLNQRSILSRLRARAAPAYLQSHRVSPRDPDHKPGKRPQMVHVVWSLARKDKLVAIRNPKKSSVCWASENPPFQQTVQHKAWDLGVASTHQTVGTRCVRNGHTPDHCGQTLLLWWREPCNRSLWHLGRHRERSGHSRVPTQHVSHLPRQPQAGRNRKSRCHR